MEDHQCFVGDVEVDRPVKIKETTLYKVATQGKNN